MKYMKIKSYNIYFKFIGIICMLFLSSCSFLAQDKVSKPISSNSLSWTIVQTWGQIASWSIDINSPFELVSVWENETKDVVLPLKNGKWLMKIQYWTWGIVKVHFNSVNKKLLKVNLQTPWNINSNIRVTYIIYPDWTTDGPFWKDLSFGLVQDWEYQIILSTNMMEWYRWSWEVILNLELK